MRSGHCLFTLNPAKRTPTGFVGEGIVTPHRVREGPRQGKVRKRGDGSRENVLSLILVAGSIGCGGINRHGSMSVWPPNLLSQSLTIYAAFACSTRRQRN